MICYFVRHGAAADAREWPGSDGDRPLTEKGRERMARVAARVAELGISVDAIITSPLVRARQTAAIVSAELGVRVVEDSRLAFGFNARGLKDILRERAGAHAIMLVGHEPSMSATIGRVIGDASIDFKKGAIACVEMSDAEAPSGTMLWMAPPNLLCN